MRGDPLQALVLGGSRFVGLRLVELLRSEGHDVTTLNRGTRRQPHGVHRIHADRRNPSEVREALRQREFDFAFDISAYSPAETGPVVEALSGRVERFVHISTAAVYGRKVDLPYTEEAVLEATADWGKYARDKIACEELLFQAHERDGFPSVILRPPYIYGPHNYIYREAFFYDRAEAGRPIPVPPGEERIQFCHVDDLAMAFLAAATKAGIEGRAFNVAASEAVTFQKLAELAGRAAGFRVNTVSVPEERLKSLFPFGNFSILLDITRARGGLAFKPRSMKVGLQDTYDWYRDNRPFGPADFSKDELALGKT